MPRSTITRTNAGVPCVSLNDSNTAEQLVTMVNEHAEALDTLDGAPVEITGARDNPEEALANLLTALAAKGIITDSTDPT